MTLIQVPPRSSWIDLWSALTWVSESSSRSPEALSDAFCTDTDRDEQLPKLQQAWDRIVDAGAGGRLAARGRQLRGGRCGEEVTLTLDDFRACRTLDFIRLIEEPQQSVLCVRKRGRDFEAMFEDYAANESFGFAHVVIDRDGLMRLHSEIDAQRFLASRRANAKVHDAAERDVQAKLWLSEQLAIRAPKSVPREQLLKTMVEVFEITKRRAVQLWAEATATVPEWRRPGRPRNPHN